MFSAYPLAEVAALLSEPARVAIITALLDASARPAGELSRCAGLSPQATSAHLARLTQGGMLQVVPTGRHRYYRLARPEVAALVEALAAASPRPIPSASAESFEHRNLRTLRTCYDHLAGSRAVFFAGSLVRQGVLRLTAQVFSITPSGRKWFDDFGIDLRVLERGKRVLVRSCLDWTERRPHLAGALGQALLARCRARRWVAPLRGTRALRVTAAGERELGVWFR